MGEGTGVALAAGRGEGGIQGGSGTEVQAAKKVKGATIPSNAERMRSGGEAVQVVKSTERMWSSFFWC